jgi:hypothetical protein
MVQITEDPRDGRTSGGVADWVGVDVTNIQGRNGPITPDDVKRFWGNVDRRGENECWLWLGFVEPRGYGRMRHCGRNIQAHQFSYELNVGPVPDGLSLDHVRARGCIHRHCVNPGHLEPVTTRENVLRGTSPVARNARAEHCPKGHPYDEANTYVRPDRGGRDCRACRRDNCKAYRARRKTAKVVRPA